MAYAPTTAFAQGRTRSAEQADRSEWTGEHQSLFPDDFPDSNPYGALVTKDRRTGAIRTFVADAGARRW